MIATKSQLNIAAKLYEAQTLLRKLHGEKYFERIAPWRAEIQRIADKYEGGNVLKAALPILKAMDLKGEGMDMLLLMAACVEAIEGKP